MCPHHMLCNGEAQARAARLSGAGLIDPVKALENSVEVFGGDARAEVADPELNGVDGIGHLASTER